MADRRDEGQKKITMFSQNLNCIRTNDCFLFVTVVLSSSFMISWHTQAVHGQIAFCCFKQSIFQFYLSSILDILCVILMRKKEMT